MAEIDDEIARLRARLGELEAQRAARDSSANGVARPASHPVKGGSPWRAILLVVGVIGVGFVAAQLGSGRSDLAPAPATNPENLVDPAKVELTPAAPREPTSPWTYDEVSDPMSDAKGKIACTTSLNEVRLDFPYSDVNGRLCVRRSPRHGLDVFVHLLGEGQILCRSYEDCTLQVRFDDKPARRQGAIGPDDNSTNTVFLHGEAGLVTGLRSASKFRVELPLYQAGNQTLEFDVSGLKWE